MTDLILKVLTLLPAVDVADGKAVRLTQGEAGSETNYGDPVDAAVDWAQQGAEWIHLVDLDAAFGRGSNTDVLRRVIEQTKGIKIELSGGIRDDAGRPGCARNHIGRSWVDRGGWRSLDGARAP
jgi:phosphoribosylformimino-5-aminoimidazole carboxamide ribonucleotide (ProFAR) isomerase